MTSISLDFFFCSIRSSAITDPKGIKVSISRPTELHLTCAFAICPATRLRQPKIGLAPSEIPSATISTAARRGECHQATLELLKGQAALCGPVRRRLPLRAEASAAIGQGVLADSDVGGNSAQQAKQLIPLGAGQAGADLVLPVVTELGSPVEDLSAAPG